MEQVDDVDSVEPDGGGGDPVAALDAADAVASPEQARMNERAGLVANARPRRARLHFLDGLRGLAAMYVLIFHSLTISVPQEGEHLGFVMRSLRSVFGYGHFAVAVFIVLSGFSLMLPLAHHGTLHLERGFGPYMWRRCRRVFPPYYAALALSVAAIVATSSESKSAALSPGSLLSHLFLVHNLDLDWAYRINGPMWSVATEFQIYFLFPLVLLPLWRARGAAFTIAVAWAVAFALHFSLRDDQNLAWAAPWFVGSFALGMWGATVAFSGGEVTRRFAGKPWGWIALGALTVLVALVASTGLSLSLPFLDAIVSVLALAWILACVHRHTALTAEGRESSPMNRFLGSPALVLLGGFSYSLYVLQHPLLRLTEKVLGQTSLGYEQVLWAQLLVGTPLIMTAALLFAEIFELPFTTGSHVLAAVNRRRRGRRSARSLSLATSSPPHA